MNKSLKTFLVVAGLAVVIVGVGNWMNSQTGADQQAVIAGKGKVVATATPTPGASTDSALYNQLVKTYRNARIQFSSTCQATPNVAAYKNGTSIMLDNRSSVAHTVTFGGATYSLPAYGHQIVTITSPTVPASMGINCGQSVNVGTLRVSQ